MTAKAIEEKGFVPYDKVKIWISGNPNPLHETLYTGKPVRQIGSPENNSQTLLIFNKGQLKEISIDTISDIKPFEL